MATVDHARHQLLNQDVRRSHVGVEMEVEVGVIGFERRCEFVHAGVVDQNVNLPRLGGQPANVVGVGQVGGDESCFTACIFDIVHRLGPALSVAAVHDHFGTLAREF